MSRTSHALIADADRLTELDQAVGDGDLGISLARGAGAVLAALPTWPVDDPAATFRALAATLQQSLGGTSGPLCAVGCLRTAAVLGGRPPSIPNEPNLLDKSDHGNGLGSEPTPDTGPGRNEPQPSLAPKRNEPNTDEPNTDEVPARNEANVPVGVARNEAIEPSTWLEALRAATAGIGDLGEAQVGDRTMLDALIPARTALAAALAAGQTLPAAIRSAAVAAVVAVAGAKATTRLSPRRGRSSYLGDRALGHPDPGAAAVATGLATLADPA